MRTHYQPMPWVSLDFLKLSRLIIGLVNGRKGIIPTNLPNLTVYIYSKTNDDILMDGRLATIDLK